MTAVPPPVIIMIMIVIVVLVFICFFIPYQASIISDFKVILQDHLTVINAG